MNLVSCSKTLRSFEERHRSPALLRAFFYSGARFSCLLLYDIDPTLFLERPWSVFWCRWITIGEAVALLAHVLVLITMVWQGTHFKLQAHLDATMPCTEDPTVRCEQGSDHPATPTSMIM